MSDHLPLDLTVNLPADINAGKILLRAMELNEIFRPIGQLQSCRFKFNYDSASKMIQMKYPEIVNSCNEGSPDVIIETIEKNIIPILQVNKVPNMKLNEPTISDSIYSECDRLLL